MSRVSAILIWLCALAWLTLAVQGVLAYLSLEPTDSGFTRGLNRVTAFLRWQAYALIAAIIAFMVGRSADVQGVTRLVARGPIWVSGGFFAVLVSGFILLVIWSRLSG